MILLLGIDIGTGGCKTTLIDGEGKIMGESQKEYSTLHPYPLWSEQNPEDWYTTFVRVLEELSLKTGIDSSNITALSITASTHNAVLLDSKMNVIRPTIMWTDQRSVKEVDFLEKNHGEEIFKIGFQKVSPTWTLPQLLWIKNNEPQNYKRIDKIMFVKDYVRYRLTDSWETDYIDAQGSLLFDMKKNQWSERLCRMIALNKAVFPSICNPTDVAGKITSEIAKITGLREGTPVIAGTSDSAVEDYAAGAIKPGQCILKLATAGNVNVMTDEPYPHPKTLTYSHVIPGMWYTVSATNTAASAKRWFRDNFCFKEMEEAKRNEKNVFQLMDKEAQNIPAGSNGLIFHPYLLGERAPYWDPHLKANFTGITMAHTKAHFVRSLMEGVAFSLRDCYRVIEKMGIEVEEFIIIGGGAKSSLWSQIVCDVFGNKITKPAVSDASFGAGLLAGVGIGVFNDVTDAVKRCHRVEREYQPSERESKIYEKFFRFYLKIHDVLGPVYKEIDEMLGEKKDEI